MTGGSNLDPAEVAEQVFLPHAHALDAALAAVTPVGIVVLDDEARVELWNAGAERIFGWSAEEVLGGRNPSVPPEDEPFSKELRARTLGGEPQSGVELVRRRRDGSTVDIALHTAPLEGTQRMVMLIEDISGRKRAHEALADSERRYRDLVNALDAIVWECGPDLSFRFVSDRAEDVLGYPVAAWYANEVWPAKIHPDDAWAEQACAEETGAGRDHELEYRMIAADGRTVWLHDLVRVETDANGRAVRMRGVMVDVTRQREAEEALRASEEMLRVSQRLEAVGRLAGGVAHDFNNLLLAIQGYGELALGTLGEDHPVSADLHEIVRASGRATALTRQLLAFGRKQLLQATTVSLNRVIGEAEAMMVRLVGGEVALSLDLDPDLPAVMADAGQLEQVLLNLVLNARDSMPDGGEIRIATRVVELDAPGPLAVHGVRGGTYVCVTVQDDGHGMDAETVKHVFEPFFTTKPAGAGTGLGLATAYGIVKQSGGDVVVESAPGAGSTFRVFLPALLDAGPPTPAPRHDVARGSGRILVVEDEDAVRGLVSEMLVRAGYSVVALPDAASALASEDDGIDLLLTDVVMPGMSGRELAEQLQARWPGLKVLYTSGYTSDAVLARGVLERSADFIQKPFTHAELTRKLTQVLGGSAAVRSG